VERTVKRAGMRLGIEKLGASLDEIQMPAQNVEYPNQLRQLYNKHFAPAAEKPTKVLSVAE